MSGFNITSALLTRKQAQPQRTYLWRLELPDITQPTLSADVNVYRTNFFNSNNIDVPNVDKINTRIRSASTPIFSTETDKEVVGSTSWNYAKKYEVGNISFDILENEDGYTFDYLRAWTALQTVPFVATDGPAVGTVIAGTTNPPVLYKFPVKLFRLNTIKMDIYVDYYQGCFISSIGDTSNDYENSGLLAYSVTLAVDSIASRSYNIDTSQRDLVTMLSQKVNTSPSFGNLTTDTIRHLLPNAAAQFGL